MDWFIPEKVRECSPLKGKHNFLHGAGCKSNKSAQATLQHNEHTIYRTRNAMETPTREIRLETTALI